MQSDKDFKGGSVAVFYGWIIVYYTWTVAFSGLTRVRWRGLCTVANDGVPNDDTVKYTVGGKPPAVAGY